MSCWHPFVWALPIFEEGQVLDGSLAGDSPVWAYVAPPWQREGKSLMVSDGESGGTVCERRAAIAAGAMLNAAK